MIRGITFGGQHAGPLNSTTLRHLVNVYSVAALSGVEAMNVALVPLRGFGPWQESYAALQRQLQRRVSMPTHLRELLDEELKAKRSNP